MPWTKKPANNLPRAAQKYLTNCAGCHGMDGRGMDRFIRLWLVLSGCWVTKKLSLVLLHGLEGPIVVLGKKYDAPEILPMMPAHSIMDDADIAAILTYIRNAWGNQATLSLPAA
ncbi:MAG: cytochrome c [Haliscomenobacter sp.]|nr:cytochrome c [Haliscomenobacter sp.]MBK9491674.1 cytochrome c [Haliscomenobacter sp.]